MRSDHPSEDDDDPTEAAALARVNRLRAARGLPPIVERSTWDVRRELIVDRDAMMVAVAVLNRSGCGATVPDAIDAALACSGSVGTLPQRVASAIVDRIPNDDRSEAWHAVNALLEQFEDTDRDRYHAELCAHRIARAVRGAVMASISANMDTAMTQDCRIPTDEADKAAVQIAEVVIAGVVSRLRNDLGALAGLRPTAEDAEPDFDAQCRRASVLNALAQLRGDADMQSEAVRLALIVCNARPLLRPSDVFREGAPVLMLPADASPADVDDALCAELAAIADDRTGP
ncbi:hypothetical protein [Mycolicibacterium iranicum]|uniref:hypothetical protein n=1 Tax=Mycolicibacterium iranicum TaxID=912594 RepID=UPI0004673773|nr:hypothetical protein [Mycolicibacterium iranicum]